MRLSTLRTDSGTRAVALEESAAYGIGSYSDIGEILRLPEWRTTIRDLPREPIDVAGITAAPLIARPGKIFCVGLNYRTHILEMGRELPVFPTLFAKFTEALIGAADDIEIHPAVEKLDWEAELAVIIGARVRDADKIEAKRAIAGYAVINDVTARDWQYRTTQWLQGKTFERTSPLGPVMVTEDEFSEERAILSCEVNGVVVQKAPISDLVFPPDELVAYISQIVTLEPGDIIATGTPGGVGHAREPAQYLHDGDVLVTRIEGIGECRNACRSRQ